MKKILLYTFIAAASTLTTSCNDYLDCEPITSVSTNVYLYSETDLAAYAAKFYNDSENENNGEYGNILPSHGSATYNLGLFQKDNGTDNQTADSPSKLFVKGQYHVGDDDLWHKYFRKIRATNYFIQTVTERYENGEISGNDANIRHYIGEVYFFRAYIYLTALQNLGDFPILTEILPDDYDAIREASKRRPRNEVARFILSDLDKAYEYMLPNAPVSNRLNKDCAALVKSRTALFEATWEKYHKGSAFVPGGPGWPGASMDYLKDFSFDIDAEIKYFLQQAIEAADIVAQGHSLHNNYAALIEAYYELNGNLGGNCDKYWKALRTRAGMSTDYQKTINNTDISKEKQDWGSYSAGQQINTTLYNIRRERRIELVSEGFRMADLKRWRALDQVKDVHVQGFNFWDSMYQLYTNPQAEDAATPIAKITLLEYGVTDKTANISAKSDPYAEGKYLLPYRKNAANIGFSGLNWNTSKYLYPISNKQFRLTTAVPGSNEYESSTIYQNPGWSRNDGTLPEGE